MLSMQEFSNNSDELGHKNDKRSQWKYNYTFYWLQHDICSHFVFFSSYAEPPVLLHVKLLGIINVNECEVIKLFIPL